MTGVRLFRSGCAGLGILGAVLAWPAPGVRADAGDSPRPDPGDAPTIEGIAMDETQDAIVVALSGEGAFGTPRIRTSAGLVRVWLPGYFGAARLHRRGDGHRIRAVRSRPGAGQTALVLVRIGDRRTVPEAAVEVSRGDGITRIELPKSALPAPPPPPPLPAAPSTDTESSRVAPDPAAGGRRPVAPRSSDGDDAAAAAAAAAAQRVDPGSRMGASTGRDLAATGEASDGTTGAERFPWDEDPATDPTGEPSSSEQLALGAASEPGAMTGPLLLLTLVLGLVYGGVRFLQSRNAPVPTASDIAVVATRRLGPKHQLLLVRALGKDHLLSVQGTTTRRLGTAPAPDPNALEASFGIPDLDGAPIGPTVTSPADTTHLASATGSGSIGHDDGDDGPGLPESTLASIRRDLEARDARGSTAGQAPPVGMAARGHLGSHRYASQRDHESDGESRFGARLFEFALDQSRATMARQEAEDTGGDDVVGGRRRSMLGRMGLRRASGDQEPDPRRSRGADSEAVAGLLRLRQRTGS